LAYILYQRLVVLYREGRDLWTVLDTKSEFYFTIARKGGRRRRNLSIERGGFSITDATRSRMCRRKKGTSGKTFVLRGEERSSISLRGKTRKGKEKSTLEREERPDDHFVELREREGRYICVSLPLKKRKGSLEKISRLSIGPGIKEGQGREELKSVEGEKKGRKGCLWTRKVSKGRRKGEARVRCLEGSTALLCRSRGGFVGKEKKRSSALITMERICRKG